MAWTRRSCTRMTASSSGYPTPMSRQPRGDRPDRTGRGGRHHHGRSRGGSALFASRFRECAGRGAWAPPAAAGAADAVVAAAAAQRAAAGDRGANTRDSRSCWRRCGSACRTCSTSPRSRTCSGTWRRGGSGWSRWKPWPSSLLCRCSQELHPRRFTESTKPSFGSPRRRSPGSSLSMPWRFWPHCWCSGTCQTTLAAGL